MKLILAPTKGFFRGMTCGACLGRFSTKDTIWVGTTQDFTLQFHTLLGAPVCDSCAEEHAPEQMAVLREIHKDAVERAEAARAAEQAEQRRIAACVAPGDIVTDAAKLLRLGIDLNDKTAVTAALQPAYEEEAVRDFYIAKYLVTARTASDGFAHTDYLPF
jgi:hypothetical protein